MLYFSKTNVEHVSLILCLQLRDWAEMHVTRRLVNLWINKNSCIIFSLLFNLHLISTSDPAKLQEKQNANDVLVRIPGMNNTVDTMSQSASRLTISYYALIAWVVVVTVALIVVVIVSYRRWRKSSRDFDDTLSGSQSNFSGSQSDIGSAFSSKKFAPTTRPEADTTSVAFDAASDPETDSSSVVHMDNNGTTSDSGSSKTDDVSFTIKL